MARVNLSIDDELFQSLEEDAKEHNCTVNVHIISLLERLYKQNPFDYHEALQQLISEVEKLETGKEFTLVELPSFADICVARAENAGIKPSIVIARLGKLFNSGSVLKFRTVW